MASFQKTFPDFFQALAKNNTTKWFDKNRKTYESEVKRPFEAFTREMLERIGAVDPEVRIAARDAISRINRDTRFSKDKSPYNLHLTAAISKFGRANREYPGILFRVSHTGVVVFGGLYAPATPTLAAVRALLVEDGKALTKATRKKAFVQHYGELRGEAMKRVPPELRAAVAKDPRVGLKRFYYRAELPAKLVTSKDLCDVLMEHWRAARPVNTFLQRAFG
jgi:uncharacterized protein (TIGR02453 family)